jgi:hypothetical protein
LHDLIEVCPFRDWTINIDTLYLKRRKVRERQLLGLIETGSSHHLE